MPDKRSFVDVSVLSNPPGFLPIKWGLSKPQGSAAAGEADKHFPQWHLQSPREKMKVSVPRERESVEKKQVQRQAVWEKGRDWGEIEGVRKQIGIMCQSLWHTAREGTDSFHPGLCTIPYLLSPILPWEVPCGQETAWRYHSNQCVGSRIKVHRAETSTVWSCKTIFMSDSLSL